MMVQGLYAEAWTGQMTVSSKRMPYQRKITYAVYMWVFGVWAGITVSLTARAMDIARTRLAHRSLSSPQVTAVVVVVVVVTVVTISAD
jgi:hypothetical protein